MEYSKFPKNYFIAKITNRDDVMIPNDTVQRLKISNAELIALY